MTKLLPRHGAVNALDPQQLFDRLFAAYGPQHWWPAESPFEVILGAILVQNTAWRGVERAIANLKQADLIDIRRLHATPDELLHELIRPAGTYRIKAARLRALLNVLVDRHDASLDRLFAQSQESLRAELLGIHGIGPETADSIILYAAQMPTFVIDAYTRRVLTRHGWAPLKAKYEQLQSLLESGVQREASLFNEYHALLVRVAKEHCRTKPLCAGCPLEPLLPADAGSLGR